MHHVPKCMSYQGTIGGLVITSRTYNIKIYDINNIGNLRHTECSTLTEVSWA